MFSGQLLIPWSAESWNAVASEPSRVCTAATAIPSALPLMDLLVLHYSHRQKGSQLSASQLLGKPGTFLNSILYTELQNTPEQWVNKCHALLLFNGLSLFC